MRQHLRVMINVRQRCVYTAPMPKIAVRPIFLRSGSCRFHSTGIGRTIIPTSINRLIVPTEINSAVVLPHLAPGIVWSQLAAKGIQNSNAIQQVSCLLKRILPRDVLTLKNLCDEEKDGYSHDGIGGNSESTKSEYRDLSYWFSYRLREIVPGKLT
jgi:hypothetical protein